MFLSENKKNRGQDKTQTSIFKKNIQYLRKLGNYSSFLYFSLFAS